jgi:hypothetical protein
MARSHGQVPTRDAGLGHLRISMLEGVYKRIKVIERMACGLRNSTDFFLKSRPPSPENRDKPKYDLKRQPGLTNASYPAVLLRRTQATPAIAARPDRTAATSWALSKSLPPSSSIDDAP